MYLFTVTVKAMYPILLVNEASTIFSLNDLLGVSYKLSTLGAAVIVNVLVPVTDIHAIVVSLADSTTE